MPEMMVVLAIIMLLAVISMPNYRRAEEKAQEAATVESLHAIHTSQEAYRISHGSYAPTFKQLTNVQGGPLLTGEMKGGEDVLVYKGYIFRLRLNGPDQYTVQAEPAMDRASRPFFRITQQGILETMVEKVQGGATTGGSPTN